MTPAQRDRINAARLFATSMVDLVARIGGENRDRLRYLADEVAFADLQASQYAEARALLRDCRQTDPRREALDGGSTSPHAARAAAAGYLVAVVEDLQLYDVRSVARLRAVVSSVSTLWPESSVAARSTLSLVADLVDGREPGSR